jgi:uncharacterized protein
MEFKVRAPLKEVGLTKAEIREFSAELGLPTADKPQMACLSSRVPHGERVTPEKLTMIERAENVLRDLGFHDVRVRHHELGSISNVQRPTSNAQRSIPMDGDQAEIPNPKSQVPSLARIEVGPAEMGKFLINDTTSRVTAALKEIGYLHVTLDLRGYHRGPANENAPQTPAKSHLK